MYSLLDGMKDYLHIKNLYKKREIKLKKKKEDLLTLELLEVRIKFIFHLQREDLYMELGILVNLQDFCLNYQKNI